MKEEGGTKDMNKNNSYIKKSSFTYCIKNNRNVKVSSVIKIILNLIAVLIVFLYITTIFLHTTSAQNPDNKNANKNNIGNLSSFSLSNNDVIYNTKVSLSMSDVRKKEILNRAKAMTTVKWIPKYNLIEKKCSYIFIKGRTYQGVPYSMDSYQVSSPKDFLSKINNSKILYGNDCSGLVSVAWGISRQTTLSLYNDIKNGSKIGNKYVRQISWNDLSPADALLIDNGKGKGHIMLYINSDKKNSDNLNVYEQDISTIIPFEPIPVAREDIRSKRTLMKKGYIPIRLTEN